MSRALTTHHRHLMIPLVSAERAWSQAMELKAQLEKEAISYKRQHMVSFLPAQCVMSKVSCLP